MKMLQQRSCKGLEMIRTSNSDWKVGTRNSGFGHRGAVVIHTVRWATSKPANRGGRVNQSVDRHVILLGDIEAICRTHRHGRKGKSMVMTQVVARPPLGLKRHFELVVFSSNSAVDPPNLFAAIGGFFNRF